MDPRDRPPYPTLTPADMIGKQTGKVQPKPTLCPFGCTEGEPSMNEHGYCKHLVGWSADGATFERRERIVNTPREICRGKHPINGDIHVCVPIQSGVRVYSKIGRAPALIAPPPSEACAPEVPYDELPDEDLETLTRPEAVTA